MAQDVLIHSGDKGRGKIRNPWGVLGLAIITLGVYLWYWWYQINREMAEYGRVQQTDELGKDPGLSVAAYIFGGFVLIPVIWTYVTTCQRIRRAQRRAGVGDLLNPWIIVLLVFVTLGIGINIYLQYQMNKWLQRQTPASAQFAPIAAANADLDRIEKLAALKESGAITDEQYEAEKARVLPSAGESPSPPPSTPS